MLHASISASAWSPSAATTVEHSHSQHSGEKKFITGGIKADYFVVAARTSGKPGSPGGLSLFLLEKGMPGLSTRRLKTQGWWASNTALVMMQDVKVPAENIIGEEGRGSRARPRVLPSPSSAGVSAPCPLVPACVHSSCQRASLPA
jgi:alkylation response protein AidB-like acyl-CoA dehydrogenase